MQECDERRYRTDIGLLILLLFTAALYSFVWNANSAFYDVKNMMTYYDNRHWYNDHFIHRSTCQYLINDINCMRIWAYAGILMIPLGIYLYADDKTYALLFGSLAVAYPMVFTWTGMLLTESLTLGLFFVSMWLFKKNVLYGWFASLFMGMSRIVGYSLTFIMTLFKPAMAPFIVLGYFVVRDSPLFSKLFLGFFRFKNPSSIILNLKLDLGLMGLPEILYIIIIASFIIALLFYKNDKHKLVYLSYLLAAYIAAWGYGTYQRRYYLTLLLPFYYYAGYPVYMLASKYRKLGILAYLYVLGNMLWFDLNHLNHFSSFPNDVPF